jgi:hypothetical protein
VLFALPEYDKAFAEFVSDRVRELATAGDGLLSGIQFVPMTSTVGSRLGSRDGMEVDIAPQPMGYEFSLTEDMIRETDVTSLVSMLDEAAQEYARQLTQALFQTMNAVTDATGNVVNTGGERLSFEHVYQALDAMEFELDENDELVMPSLVMHPETAAGLEPPTPEQETRLAELKKRKLEEALARRRGRRLS